MSLNQNQTNVELSNPQRFSNNKDSNELYQKFDECNSMINNYNFAFGRRTINPNQFIDFTKLNNKNDKSNINDRINDRGLHLTQVINFSINLIFTW